MKKLAKQFLALLFVLILALGVFPQRADAYTDHYVTNVYSLPQKKTVTLKQYTTQHELGSSDYYYIHSYYKITVPDNGYVKITSNRPDNNIEIFNKYDKNKKVNYDYEAYWVYKEKTACRVLPKGTYYLYNRGYEDVNVSWSFVKCKIPTNYCKSRAIKIKANTNVTVFNPPDKEFDKWYSFKATSSRATVTTKTLDYKDALFRNYELRDSTGKVLNYSTKVESGSTLKYTFTGLKKGKTYYICMHPSSANYTYKYSDYRLVSLSWK